MSLRTSLQKLIRRDPAARLRERAASLQTDLARVTRQPAVTQAEPETAPDPRDAELLALQPEWEARAAAYTRAIEEQGTISDHAPTIEAPPPREPIAEWARLIPGWRRRTGIEEAELAAAEAMDELCEVEGQISNMPARTLAGLRLKARIAQRNEEVSWPEGLEESLVRDILAIGEPEIEVDAELLRLGRQFEAARAREIAAGEACNAADREAQRHMPERPAILLFRASDHPLRLRKYLTHPDTLEGEEVTAEDIAWMTRKPYVREVRRPVRPEDNLPPDARTVIDTSPWPEAQERADEIVTAWEAWHAERLRVYGEYVTDALDGAANDAGDVSATLACRIAVLPALTAAGFRVKLQALCSYDRKALLSEVPDEPDPDQLLSHSLRQDMQGERRDAAEPVDWYDPPPGFMAAPAIEPFSFTQIQNGIAMELARLRGIAVAEFARLTGPTTAAEDIERIRRDLRLDILAPAPARETAAPVKPEVDRLSAEILALWPAWAAHTGDDGTDEQTAAYEAMQERRFALLHAAEALPAIPEAIPAKALALAWLHYVNEWRCGQKRDQYATDERLAIDIHMAALAQGEAPTVAAGHLEPSLVGMLDLASASLDELQALHDIADLVGGVAYATVWTARCKARGSGDDYNAAGKLMQWLGDALTDVETAANNEARRRTPLLNSDRETRLEMLALPVIQNGDPDETEAFARELLVHAAAERRGR